MWIHDKNGYLIVLEDGNTLDKEITIKEIILEKKDMQRQAPGRNVITGKIDPDNPSVYSASLCRENKRNNQNTPRQLATINQESFGHSLFEKGNRECLGNYRVVCVPYVVSRIIAQFLPSRLKRCEEVMVLWTMANMTSAQVLRGKCCTDSSQVTRIIASQPGEQHNPP